MDSKYKIIPPYFASYSMTRSGMSTDPQQGHNVFLTSIWERPNYQCDCKFIQAGFNASDQASACADKLNNEIMPLFEQILDMYHKHYAEKELGVTRVIVHRDTDGRLGWSFNIAKHKNNEWLTRDDTVMLADGRTEATLLFVFNDEHLKNNLQRLGR